MIDEETHDENALLNSSGMYLLADIGDNHVERPLKIEILMSVLGTSVP